MLGNPVNSLPQNIGQLYSEIRSCTSAGAYTASVLACRKLLMHLAVEQNAPPGKSFMVYVEYLRDNHYLPPGGEDWVDHIRKAGNEANHEIKLMEQQQASELISFIEMLLKFIYEFPARLDATADQQPTP